MQTFVQAVDGFTTMFFIFYCLYLSKYWQPWFISAAVLETAALIGLALVPESPEFLYAKGRFDEAEKVMLEIAKFNGVHLEPGQIDFKVTAVETIANPQEMTS
mmetsp:Transcript_34182/g.42266  ORF Transcript_34182/g.42266 Transcript_34182/m.42266 type:complete len:103 (+) Transcript_34182:604-912(+)